MPLITIPHTWSYKPPLGSDLNLDHPLQLSLALFLPLNEGAGTTLFDLARGQVLSTSGTTSPSWGSGPSAGPALVLDGTSQYINAGKVQGFTTKAGTYAAWVKTSNTAGADLGVIGEFGSDSTAYISCRLAFGKFRLAVRD